MVRSGFVAVRCTACAAHPALDETLREAVRGSRGGILVTTGCVAGGGCGGGFVVVQPCDDVQRPTRPALRIGPVHTTADLAAVANWLRAGRLDPRDLPAHLIGLPAASVN
jgi:hypothetical protein